MPPLNFPSQSTHQPHPPTKPIIVGIAGRVVTLFATRSLWQVRGFNVFLMQYNVRPGAVFCIGMLCYFGFSGRPWVLEQANPAEAERWGAVLTSELWALALVAIPGRVATALVDGVVLASESYTFMGAMCDVSLTRHAWPP